MQIININSPVQSCLILTKDKQLQNILKEILAEINFEPVCVTTTRNALSYFLQKKPRILCMDAGFLPRFSFRLVQLFKIAHRNPGVLIINDTGKNLAGFEHLPKCVIKVVVPPLDREVIARAVDDVIKTVENWTKYVFVKNVILQVGVAVPLLMLLIYVLMKSRGG